MSVQVYSWSSAPVTAAPNRAWAWAARLARRWMVTPSSPTHSRPRIVPRDATASAITASLSASSPGGRRARGTGQLVSGSLTVHALGFVAGCSGVRFIAPPLSWGTWGLREIGMATGRGSSDGHHLDQIGHRHSLIAVWA